MNKHTWVCWSEIQHNALDHTPFYAQTLHIQKAEIFPDCREDKTLCGFDIEAGGNCGMWGYAIHDYPVSEFVGCRRCMRIIAARQKRDCDDTPFPPL